MFVTLICITFLGKDVFVVVRTRTVGPHTAHNPYPYDAYNYTMSNTFPVHTGCVILHVQWEILQIENIKRKVKFITYPARPILRVVYVYGVYHKGNNLVHIS